MEDENMNDLNTINFIIESGEIKEVNKDILKMMMDTSNFETNESMRAIALPFLKEQEFNLILQYCQHHNFTFPQSLIKPLRSNDLANCVNDPWDALFINSLDFDKTTDLLNAATYIGCSTLTDICYARLALYLRTTPIEELKKNFNILEDEFTEEEILEVKNQNDWLMKISPERINEMDNI